MRRDNADQGFVPQTRMEARKKANGVSGSHSGAIVISRVPKAYTTLAASLTASGSEWYADAAHGLGTMEYIVNVYDENGAEVFPEHQTRGVASHRVYVADNSLDITIMIY